MLIESSKNLDFEFDGLGATEHRSNGNRSKIGALHRTSSGAVHNCHSKPTYSQEHELLLTDDGTRNASSMPILPKWNLDDKDDHKSKKYDVQNSNMSLCSPLKNKYRAEGYRSEGPQYSNDHLMLPPPPPILQVQTPQTTYSQNRNAQYVSMDCEMVGVGRDGLTSALARVTIVDYHHNVILDQYVRPNRPVTDYRTYVSGITESDLSSSFSSFHEGGSDDVLDASTRSSSSVDATNCNSKDLVSFKVCRSNVIRLLKGKVLVGHGLVNDLNILQIHHPWYKIRDTAQYRPFMKVRHNNQLWPRKLKELCYERLNGTKIQQNAHSSYEDAVAAMELFKTVQTEWDDEMTRCKSFLKIDRQRQYNLYVNASNNGSDNNKYNRKRFETNKTTLEHLSSVSGRARERSFAYQRSDNSSNKLLDPFCLDVPECSSSSWDDLSFTSLREISLPDEEDGDNMDYNDIMGDINSVLREATNI